jgi:hypothetical protein
VTRELEWVPDARRSVRFDLGGAVAGATAKGAVAVAVAGGDGGTASSSVLPVATCTWAS